jgi:hypothetical protein
MDRNEAMKDCFSFMAERHEKRKNAKIPSDKDNNPLIVFGSPPGGGKSFFADEVAEFKSEDLNELCTNKELQNILGNSLSVEITYNSATSIKTVEKNYGADVSVALRVLYTYFFDFSSTYFIKPLHQELEIWKIP